MPRTGLSSIAVGLHLDLATGSEQITGRVSDGKFTSELLADRMVFNKTNSCPWAGKYTLVLGPAEGSGAALPEGYGYATLTVKRTGGGKLGGLLGDGTKLKANAPMSKYATWPLYAGLYNKQGACIGWVIITNNTLEAVVDWFKPAIGTARYYPSGFTNVLSMTGSKYLSEANWPSSTTSLEVTLGGGNLSTNIVRDVTVNGAGAVTVLSPSGEKLTMKLTPKTGQFSGSFFHPVLKKTINFRGLFLQLKDEGAGYFLGSNESGYVTIEAAP